MKQTVILKNKLFLYLTEFFAGMSVMAVELGASRLLAPYFSSSQIVWTIIIGTIMIAMALGNIYGGRSADKSPNPDRLYTRILIAAIWIALIPVVGKYIVLGISALLIFTVSNNFLIIAAFAACMVIFVFPLFLLGTVTPSLVKYAVDSLDDNGKTVGTLGAFNTIGSIIGTFVPTFVTIPAVIKQINSLEASLGMKLFDRTHRGLVVTEAGQSIYNDAKYIIGYCKESVQRAKEAMQVSDDVIRVGISPMTPPQVFVDLWPQIQNLYPDIKFKLITFENTLENAREILANLGQNIDVVAGIFDETMLKLRGCDGTEISREPFCVAVSIHHRLAEKKKITLDDLAGENFMLMQRGWSYYGDRLRDDMIRNHPEIYIVDFDLYNVEAFNWCENENEVLLAFKSWESVHPLIKIIPVEWDYTMPFGILHSKTPSDKVKRLIKAIRQIK